MPYHLADLNKVSASNARAIVILADTSFSPEMNDVNLVRTVMSLNGIDIGSPSKGGHLVCEVSLKKNEKLFEVATGQGLAIETFVSHDIIGKLMVHCGRERGVAQVLQQLLGFEGSEFYIEKWPQLVGMRFDEIMYYFPDAVVIGIMQAKRKEESVCRLLLNPPGDTILHQSDGVIVIAQDNDSYTPSKVKYMVDVNHIASIAITYEAKQKYRAKFLFLGWRRNMSDVIMELDSFAAPNSKLMLFSHLPISQREVSYYFFNVVFRCVHVFIYLKYKRFTSFF